MEKMTDRELMTYAINLAKEAGENGEVPVGCVIALNSQIIATGVNRRENRQNTLFHAEIEAINNACKKLNSWRLTDCTMYVTLEPCPMCAGAILNSRLKRIVYGAYDYKMGCLGGFTDLSVLKFPHIPEIQAGYMENDCKKLMEDFFKNIRF